jgi:hypothetical protein
MKSDIVKGQETLEGHQKHAAFLEIMMSDGVEDPSQFFDVPQRMIDSLKKSEVGNLILIRACHSTTKK